MPLPIEPPSPLVIAFIATLALALSAREARADPLAKPQKNDIGYPADPQPSQPSPWSSQTFVTYAPSSSADTVIKKEKPQPSGFAVDAAAAIEMPIMIGGQATLEVPYRFLFQSEVGVLPAFAVNAVNGALVSGGAYDQTTGDLVKSGLSSSLVVRLSTGWRPFPTHGFEVMGGYTLMSLGGGVSAREAIQAVAGVSFPSNVPDGDISLHTTIHSFHVSLGWRWVIAEHFLVRMSLGYLQAVSSSSHVELPATYMQNATVASGLSSANQVIDSKLNDLYTTYVKLPVAGFSLGYRF